MKKILFGMFFLGLYFNCNGQTKLETYEYLNEKLQMYALYEDVKYAYSFQEIEIENKLYVNLVELYQITVPRTEVFIIDPKDYSGIKTSNKPKSKWIQIFCKPNTILTLQADSLNEDDLQPGESKSKITFILDKDTPDSEIDKIKKAFIHLLKLYGVDKKELFD